MHQPCFERSSRPHVVQIEAQIIEGLAQCKPIAAIAAEIAAQLQMASARPPAGAAQTR